MLEFFVPGEPQGKARARTVRNQHTGKSMSYTPAKTTSYEALVQHYYTAAGGQYVEDGTYSVDITAGYGMAKSMPKYKRAQALEGTLLPTKKPDLDNIAKLICDALNGVAWRDDSQIVELTVRKVYAAQPGVTITIERMAIT